MLQSVQVAKHLFLVEKKKKKQSTEESFSQSGVSAFSQAEAERKRQSGEQGYE